MGEPVRPDVGGPGVISGGFWRARVAVPGRLLWGSDDALVAAAKGARDDGHEEIKAAGFMIVGQVQMRREPRGPVSDPRDDVIVAVSVPVLRVQVRREKQ